MKTSKAVFASLMFFGGMAITFMHENLIASLVQFIKAATPTFLLASEMAYGIALACVVVAAASLILWPLWTALQFPKQLEN